MSLRDELLEAGVHRLSIDRVEAVCERHIKAGDATNAATLLVATVAKLSAPAREAINGELLALTPEVASRKLDCDRRTIMRAIEAGAVKARQGSTGRWLIDRASLMTWARARTPDPATDSENAHIAQAKT